MAFLKWLQTIRTPFGDSVLGLITTLGEETVFMILGMLLLWCVNKKWGFRFMLTGLVGSVFNQLLKAIFLIPRPWVIDPEFEIVESARAEATGYSFPSGHTHSAATSFGMLAAFIGKWWASILCAVLIVLVGFSRMYLGVHTPLDVGVSLVAGPLTVVVMCLLLDRLEDRPKGRAIIGWGVIAFAAVLVAYVLLAPKREANVAEFDLHGVKSAWTLLGTAAGIVVSWWYDAHKLHFETKAVWWAQLIKLVVGLGLVVAVRVGVKPLLTLVFGDAMFAHALRYFLMAIVGGMLWPMTFGFFAKLGQKKA